MTAPHLIAPAFDAVPAALRMRRQWVLWRLVHKSGAKKPTKVPHQPDGAMASSTDPATWTSFEAVRAAYEGGGFDGIGFVFTAEDPFVGIDLDGCRDAVSGELEPWARAAIVRFDTYCEVSPSGTGLHLIMEGDLPLGGRKRGPVECYQQGRYFTVTAHCPDGAPARDVMDRAAVLAAWHAEVFPPQGQSAQTASPPPAAPPDADDDRLLERARGAKNGRKFRRLFDDGDVTGHGSHSEADLALCAMLAFWTHRDAARIDRLFRRSALFRAKWDAGAGQGQSYGQRTVRTAVDRTSETVGGTARAGDPDAPSPPWADAAGLRTDLANARRLVTHHGSDLLYSRALGWLVWDGRRWRRDGTGAAMRRAKATARLIWSEAREARTAEDAEELGKWAAKSQGSERLRAMLTVAETEPEIALATDELDTDPWLLNVANGTLDLRTGVLREHRRDDLITLLSPVAYDPDARAPGWERFLEQVQPDPEVREFLARFAGYCLTGMMGEQVFAIHHGGGENGKGVYSDTLRGILGEYAKVTPYDTFLVRRAGGATNDLAALRGARLVVAAEPNEGVRLDEAAVKGFTGEDPITCRFHYQEFFTYQPTGKLILTGNHRPRIRGTDHAMWRRVRLVPWPLTITKEKRDNDLRRKLRDELPGILAWAVRGCLAWQREGLPAPASVLAAVEEYRQEEDHVGRFVADQCRLGSNLVVSSKDLRVAYEAWVEEEGEEPLSSRALGAKLSDRGIRSIRNTDGIRGRGWKGLALGTLGTHGRFGAESSPTESGMGSFTERSAEASQASQPEPEDPVEAAEREAVRAEGCGEPVGPICPVCDRVDRAAGADADCRTCRQFLAAKGVIPPDPRDGPAPGHPEDPRWS